MVLDQKTAAYVRRARERQRPLQELTVEEAREAEAALRALYGCGPAMRSVREHAVPVADGVVRLRVLVPHESPRGLVVYYHGGGWVTGYLEDFDALGRSLAERTRCAVALVEYRLAPEHPFPTPVDDAWAALLWINQNRVLLTGVHTPLFVAGDSAGGNLAAVMTQRALGAGGPKIDLQILVYPVVDCDLDTASYRAPENQLLLSRDTMAWFWHHYAPDPNDRVQTDVSPSRAVQLHGLPPAVIVTAEHDVLRDEGESYAERLIEAGVPVAFKRFSGQMHGFFTLVNVLPGSNTALEYIANEIGKKQPTSTTKEAAAQCPK